MNMKGTGSRFYFVGSYLCLDFINTQVNESGQPVDLLVTFDDLMTWSIEAQVLDSRQAKEMLKNWGGKADANKVVEQARELRAVLRGAVERIADGRTVKQSALDMINELLRRRVWFAELVRVKDGYEKRFHASFAEPIQLLVPVAESASDLLSEADLSLVRKCENPQCILYFYDTTKNHQRRWCSMSACGNRAKAAAHYQRKRENSDARLAR